MKSKPVKVTLLYYPPTLTHLAGHVATIIKFPDYKGGGYPPNMARELDFGGALSLEGSEVKFGKPIEYRLPPPPKKAKLEDIGNAITDIKTAQFSLFNNNCTDAAIQLLRKLGYERLSLPKTISTPYDLKNQIEENYCLQKKLNNIFEHKTWGKDEKCLWESMKNRLSPIFKLEGYQLKENFIDVFNWKEIHNSLNKLMAENVSPRTSFFQFFTPETSERYKKLSDLLTLVDMYAFPEQEEFKNNPSLGD